MPLRVAALELPARWGDPDAALADADALLAAGPRVDVALLPELALTGYVSPEGDFDVGRFAEPLGGPTMQRLAELARKHATYLGGPLVISEGGAVWNALAILDPSGTPACVYKKRHPWYPETWATPGDDPPPLLRVGESTLTVAICFDLHFVADESPDALRAADALLFASAWVERPADAGTRERMLVALAKRFDVAIVSANWGHGTPRVHGQGGSMLVGRDGAVVGRAAGAGRVDGVFGDFQVADPRTG